MATTEERDIFNNEYVQIYTNGSGNIVLLFQNEVEKTLAIGEQMNEINEEAYMNGYNWDCLLQLLSGRKCTRHFGKYGKRP